MKGTYASTFGGDDVNALIIKLQTFEGLPLSGNHDQGHEGGE